MIKATIFAFNTMKLHCFDRDSNIKFASNNELNHENYDKYDILQYLKWKM